MMNINPKDIKKTQLPDWNYSRGILSGFYRLLNWFRNRSPRLLIVGSVGVGKTMLTEFLSGKSLIDIRHKKRTDSDYSPSTYVKSNKLKGEIPGVIIDTPGLTVHEIDNSLVLDKYFRTRKRKFVIHVVAWGYHSFNALSYKETKYYKKSMSKKAFVNEYRKQRLKVEIDILGKLTNYLRNSKEKISMITLVTKQDLWWNERKKVKNHYEKGEYNTYIDYIKSEKGGRKFAHRYLSVSLSRSDFVTDAAEVIANSLKEYSEEIQIAHLAQLLQVVKKYLSGKSFL